MNMFWSLLCPPDALVYARADYVNVICATGPYKCNCLGSFTCDVGAICDNCPRETRTLGCVPDALLPATSSVVNDMLERIDDMQAIGSKVAKSLRHCLFAIELGEQR